MQLVWVKSLLPWPSPSSPQLSDWSAWSCMDTQVVCQAGDLRSILDESSAFRNTIVLVSCFRWNSREWNLSLEQLLYSSLLFNQPPDLDCIDGLQVVLPWACARHVHTIHHQQHHYTVQAPADGLYAPMLDLRIPLRDSYRLESDWLFLFHMDIHETIRCD